MNIERKLAARGFSAMRSGTKEGVEYHSRMYWSEYHHLGRAADQNLFKRFNIKYSEYMVRKYVKEKEQ